MNDVIESTNLSCLHSFRLPSEAARIIVLDDLSQLSGIPSNAYILGAGSNTLFLEDIEFPILHVRLMGIEIHESLDFWQVHVAAGENWHELVCKLHAQGIFGFENLALIPGTVGAAPVQNIGAYGREVSEFIESVEVWDRQSQSRYMLANDACHFAYRDSIFKQNPARWLITSVRFKIPKNWQAEVSYGELKSLSLPVTPADIFEKVIAIRTAKLPDPKRIPNAGSFFKNPLVEPSQLKELISRYPEMPYFTSPSGKIKLAAGWMIDYLRLKGYSIGGAAVHDKQALVLINIGSATGEDVLNLARYIQEKVNLEFGVNLEAEVRLIGGQGMMSL
ncbi:UDP-N-acetylmuramate dehydrogenase [Pseudidiomarina gelatinasegens]|uniref:UDP-N-acetylenolpyruvoylglucosamine reductase n=1 Tax=Pseudidiomarina gelatinasegens TaxID=2487740 RepID=A0A451GF88_9GAMM|nr:UDP-N-acetylmuramate dehydrogenase [Pseudidiomarina gelatinasegens]RWU11806.1 UDP-N-acetylmuramate dehydrogenase [Pseudidiomarina gelatinasegens]